MSDHNEKLKAKRKALTREPGGASQRAWHLRNIVIVTLMTGVCTTAFADGFERAKQRGKLLAGTHYPVPSYKAGTKFRTPEAPDTVLLEDVAKRLKLSLETVKATRSNQAQLANAGKIDVALVSVAQGDATQRGVTVIPTGYAAGQMAIMRTDTDIKTWQQLKGRKVCVSEGSLHVGTLATKYGAIEKVYRAPADALIAVRTGECDATVHDSAMLEELITYPEWKKFSARLPAGPNMILAFVVPERDKKSVAFLKDVVRDWSSNGYLNKQVKNATRNIAFEVYLDQNVPDCH